MLKFLTRTPDAEELQWRQRAHTLFRWALAIVAPLYLLFWLVPAALLNWQTFQMQATYEFFFYLLLMVTQVCTTLLVIATIPYTVLCLLDIRRTLDSTELLWLVGALGFAAMYVLTLPILADFMQVMNLMD